MKKIVSIMLLWAFSGVSLAQSKWDSDQQDLVNCRWRATGESLGPKLCNEFRAEAAKEKKYADERQRMLELQRQESARRQLERQQEERALNEQTRQKWEQDRKVQEEASRKESKEYEGRELAAKKLADANERRMKDKCGDDYRQAKIGMSVARAQECIGRFRMTNQINRADGIVSTYQVPGMYIHVMNDRIIAWGKY